MKGEREPGIARPKETSPHQESFIHKETLSNGMRVLVHEMPWAQSVSAVMLTHAGPRYEDAQTIGSAHFLEHELFEGSEKYPSAYALRKRIDEAGGQYHAFTDKEYVAYQAKVPPDKIDVALDYLHEVVFNPQLSDESVEREKGIITQELRRTLDTPSGQMWALLYEHAWGDHPVGKNTIGTPESIQSTSSESLSDYHRRFYTPKNSVLIISGNTTTKEAIDLARTEFGNIPSGTEALPDVPTPEKSSKDRVMIQPRDIQQAHLALTFDTNGQGLSSEMMPQIEVLSTMLGSKMFDKFVYDYGYAYSTSTYPMTISDAGKIVVSAEVAPENASDAMKKMIELVKKLPVDEETIQEAKTIMANSDALNLVDTDSYAHFLGNQEIFKGKVLSPDEIRAKIQAVSVEDIRRLKEDLIKGDNAGMVILGNVPTEKKAEFEEMLDFNKE